jgi:heme-degrading monooxygenase HmoA
MTHLAQYNIARSRAPLSDPLLAGFVAAIERVNAAAEQAPGFVWRLKDESGASSSYVRAYDDERMLINLSVWESIEALRAYTYAAPHLEIFRRRAEWFEPGDGPSLVLWWIPAGHTPTLEESDQRLKRLASQGPSAHAFTFKQSFAADATQL